MGFPVMISLSRRDYSTSGLSVKPLLFIILLEALSRKIVSGCLEELLYSDAVIFIIEAPYGMKGKLETWKGVLESKGLREMLRRQK